MELFHDIPRSQGVSNVIKRARQLVELRWAPLENFPCVYVFDTPNGVLHQDAFFPKWKPRQGVVYSSVRKYEKFVGYQVSIETYITAVNNPSSVLYTRSQHGVGKNMCAFYGTVCSSFVSYALDLPFQVTCSSWGTIPGMEDLPFTDLDKLELCDIAVNNGHVVIITDILRDKEGKVHKIAVSESTPPACITTWFTPEEFSGYYLDREYRLVRYQYLDSVGYTPSAYVPLEGDPELEMPAFPSLMTDFGNKANYRKGDEPVELSIFEEEWDTVLVTGPDGQVKAYPIAEGKVTVPTEQAGFYSACCASGEKRSHSVQWCVVDVELRTEKATYKPGEPIKVFFQNMQPEDAVIGYMLKNHGYFGCDRGDISQEAAKIGSVVIEGMSESEDRGEYVLVLVFRNQYGSYITKEARFWFDGKEEVVEKATNVVTEM